MIELHAAVDDGDADVAAGRRGVQLVEVPLAAAGCRLNSGSSWPSERNTFIGCAQATRGSRAEPRGDLVGARDAGTSIT